MNTKELGSRRKMLRARNFRVDARRIVHETIEGETILIDLDVGTYYSLTGCGPQIWELLVQGSTDADVVREMQRRHEADAESVAAATTELIEQLQREELLQATEAEDAGGPATIVDAPLGHPFERPMLERYTDMQYFLLLDPIHEVDDSGWPHAPIPESTQPPPS